MIVLRPPISRKTIFSHYKMDALILFTVFQLVNKVCARCLTGCVSSRGAADNLGA